MDKYEFGIKVEQIKKLMKKKDFITAVKIADTIDWEKVKENQLLIMAADVYEIAGKYDAARDVLLLAYEKTGLGRQLAYRLCRLSVKRGDISEAEEFYDEFTQNSPRDAGKYILQYEMAKGKGESIEKQIEILETYIEEDMDDKWAYELAKLYHKAHMRDKCVETCDTIILWFADGKYVEKALELKQLYVPLSENQRLKYEAQKSRRAEVKNDIVSNVDENQENQIQNEALYNDESVKAETTDNEENVENNAFNDVVASHIEEDKSAYVEKQNGDILDEVHEADFDVNSIHVKDYSVNNKYDTVNLQMELAKSVSSLFDNTIEIFKPNAKKNQEPIEENPEDDQIEGQMNLEEVLAMFESGELQTRKEVEEKSVEIEKNEEVAVEIEDAEEVEEKATEIEEIEEVEVADVMDIATVDADVTKEIEVLEEIGQETVEPVEIETEAEIEIEELEDIEDEALEIVDSEMENEELEELDEVRDFDEFDEGDSFEETSTEEEIVAEILAREIEFDISEEIDEEIVEAHQEERDEIEELLEEIESDEEGMETIEEDAETEVVTEVEAADSTIEEDSEVAESEIQESMPVMFDLKSDVAEENDEIVADEENEEETADEVKEEIKEETKEEKEKPAYVPRPVVQSDRAKEELKNFIGRFSGVQGLDKQILKVMQNTLKVQKELVKFIFVKGEVKSGKTTLAIEVLKLANKLMQRRDQKIAKIKAESINGKSIDGLLRKLNGSDILIEKVSDMEPDTFVEFIDKLNEEGKERLVIFEDEKSLADAFLEKVPDGYKTFANELDIKQNKIKDWTKMATDYAKKQGYTFDEMGILALSAKIDQLRAITLVVHKNHVEQLVDGAIKKSNKFSLRKLFGRAKDENGLIFITEKDFAD